MKKLISLIAALSLSASFASVAFAKPDVSITVDGKTIMFAETDAVPTIINDRTYVPVRRVLETMGAKVTWNAENRTVLVSSNTNTKKVLLTIDSPEITVYTYTSLLDVEKNTFTNDVAPIILNDRTMLPIRVVAEAIDAIVEYDEELNKVAITTHQAERYAQRVYNADTSAEGFKVEEAVSENLPKLSLSYDGKSIKKGDTVTLKIKLADLDKLYEGNTITGLTSTIFYDTENFSFAKYVPFSKDGELSATLGAQNETFYENALKFVYIFTPDVSYEPAEDGTIAEVQFEALNDKGGEFAFSNGISEVGDDNELLLADSKDIQTANIICISDYNELYIDPTPVLVK